MNTIQANAIKTAVQIAIDLLVRGEFDALEAMIRGRRLNAAQMAAAINEYGRTLVVPPEYAWELLDVVQVTNSDPPLYDVRMPLFTKEEGRSDLTLFLTLREFDRGLLETEIDGIYVP
ncbi:MAG: DUF7668 domain-containing protein [Pseudonocardiaceae bacterium]